MPSLPEMFEAVNKALSAREPPSALELALMRYGMIDPSTAEEAAIFNSAHPGPYTPGAWGQTLLSDLASQFIPSAASSPDQNIYKMMNVGMNVIGGQAGMKTPAAAGQMGALVFHGSPHKFDRFDSSKIGTGEGAQAYGHGLYLAENPKTAAAYSDTAKNSFAGGYTYKVDLPDDQIAKMLDWDKPLSQQPEIVRKVLSELRISDSEIDGFKELSRTPEGVAMLKSAGIPGIKYLDQGSRSSGKGTYNFVVFDDSIPKIVGRE